MNSMTSPLNTQDLESIEFITCIIHFEQNDRSVEVPASCNDQQLVEILLNEVSYISDPGSCKQVACDFYSVSGYQQVDGETERIGPHVPLKAVELRAAILR